MVAMLRPIPCRAAFGSLVARWLVPEACLSGRLVVCFLFAHAWRFRDRRPLEWYDCARIFSVMADRERAARLHRVSCKAGRYPSSADPYTLPKANISNHVARQESSIAQEILQWRAALQALWSAIEAVNRSPLTRRSGPAPVLFRSGAYARRPSVRKPRVISSARLSVFGTGCRSR